MKKSLKFRTLAGILAWIIALGTIPPVVSGAEDIETEPINEIYEAEPAEAEFFCDEPEETESEVIEPEAAEPEKTEPEEAETEETEPEAAEPEETEPEEAETEETEPEAAEPEETEPEEEIPYEEWQPEEEPVADVIYYCGYEAHAHDEFCYNEEFITVCGMEEHEHTELCLEEIRYDEVLEKEEEHEEEAAELYCGKEEHVHEDACWNEDYMADCGKEAHEHNENCYSLAYCRMTDFAASVELFPNEADFVVYDEENDAEILDEEAYYKAYAAFYEENPDIWTTTDALFTEASDAFAEENPEGGFDAWMQDNGLWEAAEKFYWVVPTPETVAEMTAQYEDVEEVETEFMTEEAPVLYARGVESYLTTVDSDSGINIHLFDYGSAIADPIRNDKGQQIMPLIGMSGTNLISDVDKYVDILPTVEASSGTGKDKKTYITTSGHIVVPSRYNTELSLYLDEEGYPFYTCWDNNNTTYTASLKPYFNKDLDPTQVAPYDNSLLSDRTYKYTVNGVPQEATYKTTNYDVLHYPVLKGSLYSSDGSYYEYDSRDNHAVYDFKTGEMKVAEYAVGPGYSVDGRYTSIGHFLPFAGGITRYLDLEAGNCVYYTPETIPNAGYTPTNDVKKMGYPSNIDYYETTSELYRLNTSKADIQYKVDMFIGMSTDFEFFQPKDGQIRNADGELEDMVFEFSGDDAMYIYIDGIKILDLAWSPAVGIGGAKYATINFHTGEIYVYMVDCTPDVHKDSKYYTKTTIRECFGKAKDAGADIDLDDYFTDGKDTFKDYLGLSFDMFYMDIGASTSNCFLRFNMPALPANSLTINKAVEKDDDSPEAEYITNNLEYQFRVWVADENGEATEKLFVQAGTKYDILDEYMQKIGEGTVANGGYFTLKAGQSVQFQNMLKQAEGEIYYVVEEILPNTIAGQYGEIEWEVGQEPGSIQPVEGDEEEFTSAMTGKISAESTQTVVYRNKVNTNQLSHLKITKEIAPGSDFGANPTFKFEVKLGGELLKNAVFTIEKGSEGRIIASTDEKGILTLYAVEQSDGTYIGETATLVEGIVSGTTYEVSEIITDTKNLVFYDVIEVETDDDNDPVKNHRAETTDELYGHGVSGQFALASTVTVTATNSTYDVEESLDLYIEKQVTGNMGDLDKEFAFTVKIEEDNSVTEVFAPLLFSMGTAEQVGAEDINSASDKTVEFPLSDDEKYHITGIPAGYKITITEEGDSGETDSAYGYSTVIEYYVPNEEDPSGYTKKEIEVAEYGQNRDGDRTITLSAADIVPGGYIIFTNDKTATIDTAVTLDYLPYIILFSIVGTGIVLTSANKRRRTDEE